MTLSATMKRMHEADIAAGRPGSGPRVQAPSRASRPAQHIPRLGGRADELPRRHGRGGLAHRISNAVEASLSSRRHDRKAAADDGGVGRLSKQYSEIGQSGPAVTCATLFCPMMAIPCAQRLPPSAGGVLLPRKSQRSSPALILAPLSKTIQQGRGRSVSPITDKSGNGPDDRQAGRAILQRWV